MWQSGKGMAATLLACMVAGAQYGRAAQDCRQLNGLALQYAAHGNLQAAEDALSRAAGEQAQIDCVGVALNNLAVAMRQSGRLGEAERFAERSVGQFEKNHLSDDPILLRPVQLLAAIRLERREVQWAREAVGRLQAIRTRQLTDAPLVLGTVAALLQLEGKDDEAEREYLAALQLWEKAGYANGPESRAMLNDLGLLYMRQGRLAGARAAFTRAWGTLPSQPSPPSEFDRLSLLSNLAVLHYRSGEQTAGDGCFRQAIEIAGRLPGGKSDVLASLLFNYALVLRKTHRKGEAKRLKARVRSMR